MKKFLVIGVWDGGDNGRWAEFIEAETAEEAEATALSEPYEGEDDSDEPMSREENGLTIAGVVELIDGEMVVVG
jgi:hypothetical protein